VWKKSKSVGFVNAKLKPMPNHEDIVVFSEGKTSNGNSHNMLYKPQGLVRIDKEVRGLKGGSKDSDGNGYGRPSMKAKYVQEFTNYPVTIIEAGSEGKPVHPTQKPVPLLEYLIKTYTNESETVLDNTMGSGSTGVACVNTDRKFIGIEIDEKYFSIAKKRIETAFMENLI
jgi:site-specific DNA-methyltransferase (adenine-specific)